ncbi:MAG: aromatic amino acid lyase [Actinomycetia bacterium]|nr:aromatic amino acid lyase [Actinomycetes bacterium]
MHALREAEVTMPHDTDSISVGDHAMTCRDVVQVAREGQPVRVESAARQRVQDAYDSVELIATKRPVYGRTTGVGANRHQPVAGDTAVEHGLRLLRSHAGGAGPLLPTDHVRAALVIRLNQLTQGGAGVQPEVVDALERAIRTNAVASVHRLGAIGTGDIAPLAEIALTLAGERPWTGTGHVPPVPLGTTDALSFISSNAVTLAEAALACAELQVLLRASHAITALTFLALGGSTEAIETPVQQARPHPGQSTCAAELRRLLGVDEAQLDGRRIQDPFGLRAFPQVHGPALDSVATLERVLEVEINARAENPLVDVDARDVFHNANFHTAYVTLAIDQARAAVHHTAELSTARLGDLAEPAMTDLPPFLASGPAGSSGVMILEYVAQDALAQLRQAAMPVTLGNAVISRGLEDHASFSTQAARQSTQTVEAFRYVLACELVAAARALHMQKIELADVPAKTAWNLATRVLDPTLEDRSLSDDVEQATDVLPDLAAL